MTAAGTRSSLFMTSSAALQSSSATASSVPFRVRPSESSWPREARMASIPATPRATLTSAWRKGRPKVSLTRTARPTPKRAERPWRSRSALASASSGRSSAVPASPVLLRSTPALAQTNPCRVSTTSTPGAARRTALLCERISSTSPGSNPVTCARAPAFSLGAGLSAARRASALDTILLATTTMSPSSAFPAESASASPSNLTRSSPALISGTPITGTMLRLRSGPQTPRHPDVVLDLVSVQLPGLDEHPAAVGPRGLEGVDVFGDIYVDAHPGIVDHLDRQLQLGRLGTVQSEAAGAEVEAHVDGGVQAEGIGTQPLAVRDHHQHGGL